MNACVLDASATLAWILPDEGDADAILERVTVGGAVVPGLWAIEVGAVLLKAERRGRISDTERSRALELLSKLPIWVDLETA